MTGYVYLMRCNRRYKIGIAKDVDKRLSSIQTGNPYTVTVVQFKEFDDPATVEKELHRKYDARNVGGEWFTLQRDEVDWLIDYLGGQSVKRGRVEVVGAVAKATTQVLDSGKEPMPECHWISSHHPRRSKYLLSKAGGLDLLSSHLAMSGEDLRVGNRGRAAVIAGFTNPNNVMYAMKVLEDAQLCVSFSVQDDMATIVVYGASVCFEPDGKCYFQPAEVTVTH